MAAAAKLKAFGHGTPAIEVAQRFADRAKGRSFLVTGAAAGLGFETCRVLALVGGRVTVAVRSQAGAEDAIARLRKALGDAGAGAELSPLALDLSSIASIESGAAAFLAANPKLDVLINNAGVMACPLATTKDGMETQIGVNHVGHQHLTSLLLPALAAAGTASEPARVVSLSSIAHFLWAPSEGINFEQLPPDAKTYRSWPRYGESKLANLLMAAELTRRCAAAGQHVIGVSLHPGLISATKLGRHLSLGSIWAMTRALLSRKGAFMGMLKDGLKKIPAGSSTTLVAALDPAIQPGAYYANCQLDTRLHPKVADKALAARLWAWTEAEVARCRPTA